MRLSPLVPGAKFGQFSLWDFQLSQRPSESQRREDLHQAASEAGVSAMAEHLKHLTQCIANFDALTLLLTERCGDQAPPSSNTRNVLLEAAAAIRQLAGIENDAPAAAEIAPMAANSNSPEPKPRGRAASASTTSPRAKKRSKSSSASRAISAARSLIRRFRWRSKHWSGAAAWIFPSCLPSCFPNPRHAMRR